MMIEGTQMTTIAHSKVNPVGTTSKAIVVKVPERYEQHRAKSYAMLRIPSDDGTYRQGFRLHCGKCKGFTDVTNEWWGSTKHITLKFERAGWIVNERHVAWCVCPQCQVVKAPRTAEPQEYPSMQKHNGTDLINATQHRTVAAPLLSKEVEPMSTPPQLKPAVIPSLSPEVKAKIRQVLDRVFDDSKGAYLIEGSVRYSDEVVAKEVDLPRAVVISYRELAYGPLLSDPEIDELRVLLLASQRTIEAELQRIEVDRVKLTSNLAQLVELKQRIERCERRVAQA